MSEIRYMYHTVRWNPTRITRVEVVKETKCFITYRAGTKGRESREDKKHFHETLEAAKEHLVTRLEHKRDMAEATITRCGEDITKIEDIEESDTH